MSNVSQVCNILLEQLYLIRTASPGLTEELSTPHSGSHSHEQQMLPIQNKNWASIKHAMIAPPVQPPCFKQPEAWAHPQTKI